MSAAAPKTHFSCGHTHTIKHEIHLRVDMEETSFFYRDSMCLNTTATTLLVKKDSSNNHSRLMRENHLGIPLTFVCIGVHRHC